MSEKTVTVYLKPLLTTDEPSPLGTGQGPSPMQLLCALVGNCLVDSLLFTLRKFKQLPEPLTCMVVAEVGKDAERQIRVLNMAASLHLGVAGSQLEHWDRVLEQFESVCTVTQSVRQSIPIAITVYDAAGGCLKR